MVEEELQELKRLVVELRRIEADIEAGYRNGVRDDDCDRASRAVIKCADRIAALVKEPA